MKYKTEPIFVDANGALRAVLMEVGDVLIDLCRELDVSELKISVSRNHATRDTAFKAKSDGKKVLEITANDSLLAFMN